MGRWFKRARSVLGMGVIWALGWAIVGGGIMEGIVDPNGQILDMWPQTLAIPGFIVGVLFALLLWIKDGRRRFDELSLPGFTALGAAAGAVLGVGVLIAGIFPTIASPLLRAAVVLAPLTLLSAASAASTLAIARRATREPERLTGGAVPALEPPVDVS